MVNYEFIYGGGGYDSQERLVDPINADLKYSIKAGQLGFPMSVQNVNQLQEVSNALNTGVKAVEVGVLNPEVFQQIPKQHFKEIKRLAKLTDAEPSLHAPLVEPSGFVENRWSESNKVIAENQLLDAVEKAYEMDVNGNIPVTIHGATSVPGEEFVPDGKGGYTSKKIFAVNRESGEIAAQFIEEEMAYPEEIGGKEGKPKIMTPEDRLRISNSSQWIRKIESLQGLKKSADEVIDNTSYGLERLGRAEQLLQSKEPEDLSEDQKRQWNIQKLQATKEFNELAPTVGIQFEKSNSFLSNAETSFRSMFEEAYKYSDDKNAKKDLKKLAQAWVKKQNEFEEKFEKIQKKGSPDDIKNFLKEKSQFLDNATLALSRSTRGGPEVFQRADDFALEKTADTLSNVALKSYNKFKDKAPIISIENLYEGTAFGKPEKFRELIDKTRKEFIEKAKGEGISESKAKEIASKQIGVTWDVGHLNMMRKYGFKEEDLVKATKMMKKDIKHVHLTDNFGHSDSHLSPGMGNVPFKKILEQMEKSGVDLRDVKMINEAGAFAAGFKTNPHSYLLEAFGSPVYASGQPLWSEATGASGGYFSGYGEILPQHHFSMYGAGFSGLPTELGGQVGGARSRMSGAPNA